MLVAGMESGFPHQMGGYPNQTQMWANFYGPGSGGPPGEHPARFPHPGAGGPPHMGMDGGWWQGHPHPPGPPDMGPYRMGTPGLGGLAPGPWALRGPRPRGERRGPGRPRLTTKGERGSRGRAVTHPTDDPQFPTPFPDGLAPDMMGGPPDMKRGPGRPKALLDPNVPKVPGETTKNGNKKRYTCEICQKRFSTAWYVRVHRRSHNGERPYVCNNCGKGFMLPNVLQVHLRKCEKNNPPAPGSAPVGPAPPGTLPGPPGHRHLDPAAQLAAQVPPSPISSQPNQSPNSTASPNLSGPPTFGDYHGEVPGSIAQSQGSGQQFPNMTDFNQRYMGGLTSTPGPPFPPGLGGPDMPTMPPISQPQQFPPEQPVTPGFAMHQQQQSPHERGSPHQGSHQQYSSPIYSPNYSPTNSSRPGPPSDSSENHFLDNDKPRDKGGTAKAEPGPERPCPPGVDPSLYCTTCEVKFEDKTLCEEHVKTHRPFSCEICEKRFSQKCNLVTHMRLHTGEKPYNCEYCDKRFTQKGNLDAHTKTHTKEKPYPCVYCPKRFAFKSSMQSHVRGHQNGVGCPPDVDEDDMDVLKDQMRLSKDSQEEEEGMTGLEEQDNEDFSPSISPTLPPTYGGTIKQFNSAVATSPENDNISKLTDSRQTVAMLQ